MSNLKTINEPVKIVETFDCNEAESYTNSNIAKSRNLSFYLFITLVVVYIGFSIYRVMDFRIFWLSLSRVQVLNTVFLSILMQAFPFILVGVFVSSIIQVFISSETLVKLFPHKMGMGYIAAMFGGTLFPICDCGIVPVATRLMKKGVPLSTVITFMLSAPIVNPIVIISTLYAFPGQSFIAFYRVFFGLSVALAVGLTFSYSSNDQSLFISDLDHFACDCGHCHEEILPTQGFGGKVQSVFNHAGSEFFEVGKFLIIGAFISSLMQTMVPKDIFTLIGDNSAAALLVMMTTAFVLSVCSTSDAFIARTFLNQFSIGSIMGFLVLGPMIDVKNMLMLLSSFKRSFVIRLIAIILVWAFIILYFLAPLL